MKKLGVFLMVLAAGCSSNNGGSDAGDGGSDVAATDVGSDGSNGGTDAGRDVSSSNTDSGSGNTDAGSVATDSGSGNTDAGSGSTDGGTSSGLPWDPKELPSDPDLPNQQVVIPPVPAGSPAFRVTDEATLRAALANSRPGDKIEIENSFSIANPVTLPNKGAGSEYITIYSAGWDTNPPVAFAENTGQVPHVSATTPMFTITTRGNGAFDCANGAHHYHFVGIEFVYDASVADSSGLLRLYAPSLATAADQPHHILIDRVRARGFSTPTGPSHWRAVIMNANYSAVHQSYMDGFFNLNSDSQAIASWSSSGPLRITNNFLEGASETIILGGADTQYAGAIPSDVEIRFNHMYKRNSYQHTGFAKNLFEIKFARRVLVESNILENYAVDQQSSAVNIKINPAGALTQAETDHVTFRYNVFRKLDTGLFKIGAAQALSAPQQGTHDVLLAHNYADGAINPTYSGWFFQFLPVAGYPMDHIAVRNNTALGIMNSCVSAEADGNVTNFTFLNNICDLGQYGVKAGGVQAGTPTLDAIAPGSYQFAGNVLVGQSGNYPSGNQFAATIAALGLTNWNAAGGSDVSLSAGSPYRSAGTNGSVPGANVALIDARVVGVAYTIEVP